MLRKWHGKSWCFIFSGTLQLDDMLWHGVKICDVELLMSPCRSWHCDAINGNRAIITLVPFDVPLKRIIVDPVINAFSRYILS